MSSVVRDISPQGSNKGLLQVCRLCLSEEFLEDIFNQNDLRTWISDLLSIEVTQNDSISHSICAVCKIRLNDFREYQLRCLEVQDVLRSEPNVIKDEKISPKEELVENSPSFESSPLPMLEPLEETILEANSDQEMMVNNAPQDQDGFIEESNLNDAECYPDDELPENSQSEEPHDSSTVEVLRVVGSSADEDDPESEIPYSQETKTSAKQIMACGMCGENLPKARMESHMNKHLGLKPFKCERGCISVCFTSEYNRVWHYRHIHDAPQYWCFSCKRTFGSRQGLFGHKQRFHSTKSHRCTICAQAFVTEYRLNKHMLGHGITDRQFSCPTCDASFPTDYALKRHVARKHVPSGGDDFGKNWLQVIANQSDALCEGEAILPDMEPGVPATEAVEIDSDPEDLMIV